MAVARNFFAALLLAALAAPTFAVAQDPVAPPKTDAPAAGTPTPATGTPTPADPAAPGDAPKSEKKPTGRLPKFYERVIDGIQREKIYQIQADYSDRIKVLQDQIDAIKKERDAKVEELLTPEQRERVKQYQRESIEN